MPCPHFVSLITSFMIRKSVRAGIPAMPFLGRENYSRNNVEAAEPMRPVNLEVLTIHGEDAPQALAFGHPD